MKAIVLNGTGGPGNLILAEIPIPSIKENEVLIATKAISINPVDAAATRMPELLNYVYQIKGDEKQIVLGWDVAGVVTAAGTAVTRFKTGDEVFGMVKFPGQANGYAEYVAAPEGELVLKPRNISFNEAAGATLAALTAWQSLVTNGNVKKGDKVVITGASGGVGHYAVQIAKYFGAYVIAVASAANKDFVLSLGADEFIDYKTQSFEDHIQDADIVHDAVWSDDVHHVQRSLKAIKSGGKLLSLIVDLDEDMQQKLKAKEVAGMRVYVQANRDDLQTIADLLERGAIKTYVSATFPLEQTTKAHGLIQTKNAVGKIIVTV
ncbi:NADP-dependent oxidoreductase [Pedobacter frigiditerrae]|uniref:NADP-dependent oxidoreductase n=1 Tax=Pedobacter frigiditerrae TaxID=2530452 RepID=A0A4R0N2P6_9SPHI|nr:NADP-dependent oxidoreductase [Pedobacter frigiditerrae]TCC93627.1 NADP-dependent oxidoreductase [Pedobacter frigiditerrae]